MTRIYVPSDKNPYLSYEVDPIAGTCTCPHFTQKLSRQNAEDGGERVCKHITRIRDQHKRDDEAVGQVH